MGFDIYFAKPILGGKITDELRDELGELSQTTQASLANAAYEAGDQDTFTSITMYVAFRYAEALGDYFRASIHTWNMILAEMAEQGMLDEGGIPLDKVKTNRGDHVTPAEIMKALEHANPRAGMTPERVTGGADPMRDFLGGEGVMIESQISGKAAHFPFDWVKWLAFMERAAAIGDGFLVH